MPRAKTKAGTPAPRQLSKSDSASPNSNPFRFHKFWASKPVDIALQYLDKWGQGRKVLLDPFAGSGVFVYVALLKNMSAIYNDCNPFAVFLARNTLNPCSTIEIQDAYSRVLDRRLTKDLVDAKGKVFVPRGTSVEEVLSRLYSTRCNICGTQTEVDYFVWDTTYNMTREAVGQVLRKDPRMSYFLELCKKEKGGAWSFHQSAITERWKEIVDKNPSVWLKPSKKQIVSAALVTLLSSKLVRGNIARKSKREPIYKSLKCPKDHAKQQEISPGDWETVRKIEALVYPFPFPETHLTYSLGGRETTFFKARPATILHTAREHEPLNTVTL